ncbi:MAG TPA: hypothetical protein VKQ32_00905 [Polyangia bacterium]|nr:hypothetical protein [Polyangia bacterium]
MPRSSAPILLSIVSVVSLALGGACTFAPPTGSANSGSAAAGGPLGSGASSGTGTGLVSGGGAQSGSANNGGMNCATVNQPVNKLPPDILLIQDKSGSMADSADGSCTQNCGMNSKWSQMTAGLMQVLTSTDMGVNWGLKWFASPNGGTCGVNQGADVPIAAMNAARINTAIMGQNPSSSTPTRMAVNAGAAYMMTVNDANPKFLLLATDGLPNCIPTNNGGTCTNNCQTSDMQGAIDAVTTAAGMGFPTFVVGIATTSDPTSDATLNAMAMMGGKPQANGPPYYYPVANQQDLVNALGSIVSIASTCVFTIPQPPNNSTDQTHIGVQVNGTDLPQDTSHANGWDFSGTGQVTVYGSQCNAIMAGTATVAIVFKCIVG